MGITINSRWDYEEFMRQKEYDRKHINSLWDAQKFYETYGGNGQVGNWGSREWRESQQGNAYVYNPSTRKWSPVSMSNYSLPEGSDSLGLEDLLEDSLSQSSAADTGIGSSKDESEKDYIETEFNILTGDLQLIPTKKNMSIRVGNTISLRGFGKYLNGLYFVSEIKKRIDKDSGFSLSLTLYRNGFGETLKSGNPDAVVTREDVVNIEDNKTKFKVGDRVKIVGDDAVYSNASLGVKVPDWVKTRVLVVDAISEDGNRARLNPIWSWTFTKYLQLV